MTDIMAFSLSSAEAEIDSAMEELARKLAEGTASPTDIYRYQELSMRRSLLAEPRLPPASSRRPRVA